MTVRVGSLLGWGVVIYALMYLLWSAFVTYGFIDGLLPRVVGFVVLVIVCIIAGRSLHAHSWRDVLPYSFAWGIMMAALDVVMSVPFAGWEVYADPNVWFGYAVVVVAPL